MIAKFKVVMIFVGMIFASPLRNVMPQERPASTANKDRLAFDGNCCVSAVELNAIIKGDERYTSRWRGLNYQFLSEEEKIVFDSNPEKYAVAFGGLDIVATYGLDGPLDKAEKTYGAGSHNYRFEDRTYHFANEANFRLFTKSPSRYIARAQQAAYLNAEKKRGKSLAELYPEK